MHLNTETLLAYRDGELNPDRMKTVEPHLANCPRCRREAHQLQYELELFLTLHAAETATEPARLDEGLEKLLAGIHKWQSAAGQEKAVGARLEHRITAHLAEYLGSRLAEKVAHSAHTLEGSAGVLPMAEPLLCAFLGRKGASALTSELLQELALERGLAPELL